MKRLMFVAVLLGVLCLNSVVQARYPYPNYWNGDRNFPLIWGHMGLAFYLDKTSLVSNRLSDKSLTIGVNMITVDERGTPDYFNPSDGTLQKAITLQFFFNESDLSMFHVDKTTDELHKIPPLAHNSLHYYGEAAYYIVVGKKFHGSKSWINENTVKYAQEFEPEFYNKL